MLKLCGFHISNYHNKVRIVLLEKGIAFDEEAVFPSQREEFLARTPLGKVPFLELSDGRRLTESSVICEYLEDAFPGTPLLPADPFERAKVRELVAYLEVHVELVVRRLYGQLFFGQPADEAERQAVEKDLAKGLRGLAALVKFSPYIAGGQLTLADCAAFVHLPIVSAATKAAYGRDWLDDLPHWRGYVKMLEERPAFRRVNEDRKAAFAARRK
ncbi:MAG: glutathione S-transferase family protein [Betaproteobacteria bacterium]|jgi:glutathione S-transferase|nr:glutathione S-transferase family protein [Rhodocyclaceae bacterium]MCA3135620.1 glutathione S-transferase family protein [Rhodocyclaceae bacterium]MCA3141595.1 glutathione S-transferase family protein [Rhodocyclaceae bacterium]MCA3146985.1 glutathione S-transferase family protein [Rhodocyclaceae bacterium]MCE2897605.1 glutathione S-transferase family protein [Betaproteobacteria bacterium]